MDTTEFPHLDIFVRTRTGKKIHAGSPGSSVTRCGHWLKVNSAAMGFPAAQVVTALERGEAIENPSALGPRNLILCGNCFPNGLSAEHARAHFGRRFRYVRDTPDGPLHTEYAPDEEVATSR